MQIFRTLNYIYKSANKTYKNYSFSIITEIIFTVLSNIMIAFLPKIYMLAIEKGNDLEGFLFYAILITLVFIAIFTLQSKIILFNINRTDILRNNVFTKRYLNKILHIDYPILEEKSFHERSSKAYRAICSEAQGISAVLNNTAPIIASTIATVVMITIIISLKSTILNFSILFIVLTNLFLTLLSERIQYKHFETENNLLLEQKYYTQYCLNYKNNKDIKNYDIFNFIKRKYMFSYEKFFQIKKNLLNKEEKIQFFSNSISIFATAFFYYIIAINHTAFEKKSDILFFLNLIVVFPNIVLDLFNSIKQYILGAQQTQDYLFVLNLPENISSEDKNIKCNSLNIGMKNVSFMYSNAATYALKNISLDIDMGMKIAIVGENGSGKTTLIKLLLKLYTEYTGTINIGNQNLNSINTKTLYNFIGCIFQNTKVFPFTIKENIILNNEFYEKDFVKTLEQMHLNEIISNLKLGKDTYLNKDFISTAVDLSGGENKKILLSRILYKNPSIIILDEPVSSLDVLSEKNLYENINKCSPNSTIIFTTHHLISTKFCDKIFFMEKGEIIESGTHDELIKQKGKYYNMFMAQYMEFQKKYNGVIENE